MRPAADHRRDIEFKEEKLREIGLERIVACFDDLEHVAKHIRSLGVTCHLVTHYDTNCVSVSQHVRYPGLIRGVGQYEQGTTKPLQTPRSLTNDCNP